jgi:hypothetical protein
VTKFVRAPRAGLADVRHSRPDRKYFPLDFMGLEIPQPSWHGLCSMPVERDNAPQTKTKPTINQRKRT